MIDFLAVKVRQAKSFLNFFIRKGGDEMGNAFGGIYTCRTCGMIATEKGHLCAPAQTTKVTKCSYCGRVASDPRHVCEPKLVTLKFYCDTCGRLSNARNMLCNPLPIPRAASKKAAKKKKVKRMKKAKKKVKAKR